MKSFQRGGRRTKPTDKHINLRGTKLFIYISLSKCQCNPQLLASSRTYLLRMYKKIFSAFFSIPTYVPTYLFFHLDRDSFFLLFQVERSKPSKKSRCGPQNDYRDSSYRLQHSKNSQNIES